MSGNVSIVLDLLLLSFTALYLVKLLVEQLPGLSRAARCAERHRHPLGAIHKVAKRSLYGQSVVRL